MLPALIAAGGSLLGGALASRSATKAAQASANAQIEAARIAAEEARFRPVGITSRFGSSNFQIDPTTGRLTSAGYDVAPDIAALRESLLGGAGTALGQAQGLDLSQVGGFAQGLFGLGSQFMPSSSQPTVNPLAQQFASQLGQYGQSYLPSSTTATLSPEAQRYASQMEQYGQSLLPSSTSTAPSAEAQRYAETLRQYGQQFLPDRINMEASPEAMAQAQGMFGLQQQITPTSYDPNAAAQRYFEEQQAILDPARQRQEQRLGASVFGRGRAGLNISGQGQPELFALAQSRGEQDLVLAAQARERARQELQQDIGLGTNLGMQGLSTLQNAQTLARQRGIEDISTGLELAGRGLSTEEQAQELARRRFSEDLGLGFGLTGQGLQTREQGQDLARRRIAEDVGMGFGLMGQGIGAGESATDLARSRMFENIGMGTGLFGSGLGFLGQIPQLQTAAFSPFQTQLGLAQQLEAMGQQPLSMGAELGGGNTASAQALLQGGMGAAGTQLQGSLAANAARYGALQDLFGNQQLMSGLFGRPSGGFYPYGGSNLDVGNVS
jgi:hypothetical protein